MALILNIDTSTEIASVSISEDGKVFGSESNPDPKNHGAFLQPAIKKLLDDVRVTFDSLDAVAVANGPGSYTGLRVGLSSAKGICYAMSKPLITINTLQVLALASLQATAIDSNKTNTCLLCPMIDARRMEVFTALYNVKIETIMPPQAIILDANSFNGQLAKNTIVFSGSGKEKFKNIINNNNALFVDIQDNIASMAVLAHQYFSRKDFASLAYAEPFYVKEVYFAEKK
ncbi:tRNA (adenosine(37)-N6)-threonylcarbamoyltransferase complex dimerization subunit type 1 TsaB [Parasediminibacterium sp. JCM 36343]|uniref:tRNA (adenosine(37)-N6)-threonylcarbamoyltransferase complex dimerization subunit type 1 TsaB n=1 Tax=Parasediminibacterium sp. JCM 36343 TaxID=3374279 RepID=UPI00397D1442